MKTSSLIILLIANVIVTSVSLKLYVRHKEQLKVLESNVLNSAHYTPEALERLDWLRIQTWTQVGGFDENQEEKAWSVPILTSENIPTNDLQCLEFLGAHKPGSEALCEIYRCRRLRGFSEIEALVYTLERLVRWDWNDTGEQTREVNDG